MLLGFTTFGGCWSLETGLRMLALVVCDFVFVASQAARGGNPTSETRTLAGAPNAVQGNLYSASWKRARRGRKTAQSRRRRQGALLRPPPPRWREWRRGPWRWRGSRRRWTHVEPRRPPFGSPRPPGWLLRDGWTWRRRRRRRRGNDDDDDGRCRARRLQCAKMTTDTTEQ